MACESSSNTMKVLPQFIWKGEGGGGLLLSLTLDRVCRAGMHNVQHLSHSE